MEKNMSRKTISLAEFVEEVNRRLASGTGDLGKEGRQELQNLTAHLLIKNNAYSGFQYVHPGGELVSSNDVRDGKYDRTRIRFVIHPSLRSVEV